MSRKNAPAGMVKITNKDLVSYVLPESVPVWEKNGWKAAAPDKASEQNETKTVTTTDGEKATVVKGVKS